MGSHAEPAKPVTFSEHLVATYESKVDITPAAQLNSEAEVEDLATPAADISDPEHPVDGKDLAIQDLQIGLSTAIGF